MLVSLPSQLCFNPGFCTVIAVVSYLQYVFSVVMFIVPGAWTKIIIEGYFVVLVYGMLVLLLVNQSGECIQYCKKLCTLGLIY